MLGILRDRACLDAHPGCGRRTFKVRGMATHSAISDATAKGQMLFRTSTCINCHAIRGVAGADLRVAPDLTHVGSRKQLAAGILENTPANMRVWLKSPQHIKPGALMPDFNFTDEQLDQLAEYLSTLQ